MLHDLYLESIRKEIYTWDIYMPVHKYPGYEAGQGWTMKPGNLEEGFWRRYKGILGSSPRLVVPPDSPLKILRFHCPTPGLFHTLDIYTLPSKSQRSLLRIGAIASWHDQNLGLNMALKASRTLKEPLTRSPPSFPLTPPLGWSFGITIKPFKSLVRASESQSQLDHTNHGGAAEGRPPSLLSFNPLWLLKGSWKAL